MSDERFYHKLGPLALDHLLDGLDVELPEGQFCDMKIDDAASFNQAKAHHITYLTAKGAKTNPENCQAGVCLVSEEMAALVGAQNALAVISKNPRADFAKILPRLYKIKPYSIKSQSDTAFIDETAIIGAGTKIDPNVVIGPDVVIGKNCHIRAGAVITFTTMGDNCIVQNGAVLGSDGFGVALDNGQTIDIMHVGTVVLGDDVTIGANTCVDRAMFGATEIGSGTKLDNLIQIAHNCKIGKNCMIAAHTGISGSCIVGDNVIMGGRVGLADHLRIGDGAILMAGSGLMKDVPAGEIWGGVPAMPAKQFLRQAALLRKMTKPKKN